MSKRYYWYKLYNDFFMQKSIRALSRLSKGDKYTLVYIKMILATLQTEGKLEFEGYYDTIEEEIAEQIDEAVEDVTATLDFLYKHHLAERTKQVIYLKEAMENLGSESSSAARMRNMRKKTAAQDAETVSNKR